MIISIIVIAKLSKSLSFFPFSMIISRISSNSHAKSFLCAVFFETPIHKQDFYVSSKFCGPKNEVSKWIDSMNLHSWPQSWSQCAKYPKLLHRLSAAKHPPQTPSTSAIDFQGPNYQQDGFLRSYEPKLVDHAKITRCNLRS